MITPLDFLADLFNPSLAFLPRALAAVLLASVVTGVVGCHVMMRGMVFIGDAVAHSVFPGLAVAFVLGGNLMVGGLTAGVVTAILVAIFSQNQRLREDSVIGIFFAASFALGIVIISLAPGYSGSVQDFLFGSIVGVSNEDITNAAIMGAVILLVLWLFHRQIVTVSLDRESARAMGLPVLALDIVLYVLVTISVVLGLQTLGNGTDSLVAEDAPVLHLGAVALEDVQVGTADGGGVHACDDVRGLEDGGVRHFFPSALLVGAVVNIRFHADSSVEVHVRGSDDVITADINL